MDEQTAHIEVELNFLSYPTRQFRIYLPATPADGPAFESDGQTNLCSIYLVGREWVMPGEEQVAAFINFFMPELVAPRLRVGGEFVLSEGRRIVARGKITKLLTLEQAAARNTDPKHTS